MTREIGSQDLGQVSVWQWTCIYDNVNELDRRLSGLRSQESSGETPES